MHIVIHMFRSMNMLEEIKEKWDDIDSILKNLPIIYNTLSEYVAIVQQPFAEVLNQFANKITYIGSYKL